MIDGGRTAAVSGVVALALLLAPACSVERYAIDKLGDALAGGSSVYASDDDPELVRDAVPFGLKTVESLLARSPRHPGLLLAAASGFTQYAYAFVQSEADVVEDSDLLRAAALRERAARLYRRGIDYGFRGLETREPGVRERLRAGDADALAAMRAADVPLLYWTGVALGASISLDKMNAEKNADLPVVEALLRRALALDPSFGLGAIHDFFIVYEGGRPASAGGSIERARAAFARANEASGGRRAAPYVALAETVSVGLQDRAEFERLLGQALAVDVDAVPDQRLANVLAQRRARWLLGRIDLLFIE